MNILIRTADLSDYKSINRMLCELHNHHVKNKPDIYKEVNCFFSESEYECMLKENQHNFILSVVDDTISGFLWYRINTKGNKLENHRKQLWIEGVYVEPIYRGLGIAEKMMLEVINIAAQMKVCSVETMVWAFNDTSLNLFKKKFNIRAYILTHDIK